MSACLSNSVPDFHTTTAHDSAKNVHDAVAATGAGDLTKSQKPNGRLMNILYNYAMEVAEDDLSQEIMADEGSSFWGEDETRSSLSSYESMYDSSFLSFEARFHPYLQVYITPPLNSRMDIYKYGNWSRDISDDEMDEDDKEEEDFELEMQPEQTLGGAEAAGNPNTGLDLPSGASDAFSVLASAEAPEEDLELEFQLPRKVLPFDPPPQRKAKRGRGEEDEEEKEEGKPNPSSKKLRSLALSLDSKFQVPLPFATQPTAKAPKIIPACKGKTSKRKSPAPQKKKSMCTYCGKTFDYKQLKSAHTKKKCPSLPKLEIALDIDGSNPRR